MLQRFVSKSFLDTEAIGESLAKTLSGTEIIAFFGGLGMGKTAFTRGLARGISVAQGVSSPTFAIVNEYSGLYKMFHFDMYRINSWEDLYSTGFFDMLDTGILVVEWSENIENALPEEYIRVEIEQGNTENERNITIKGAKEIEYTCP